MGFGDRSVRRSEATDFTRGKLAGMGTHRCRIPSGHRGRHYCTAVFGVDSGISADWLLHALTGWREK
jgi:hypothetical protein